VAEDGARHGNCLDFADSSEIVYAGDIHGHRQNLAKIIRFADLPSHRRRRLVLQELLHGGPADEQGGDRSFELMLRAARLKANHPDGVYFLISNHDLAQFTGSEVTKDGHGMCQAFDEGLDHSFGDDAGEVRAAVHQFLRRLPLAGRCPNGILMTHSLPAPRRMELIDWDIFDRPYRDEDFQRGGTVYEWTWGRGHTADQLQDIGRRLDARQFLLGHQPVEAGFEIVHQRAAIVASDDAHGAVMVFQADQAVPDDQLASLVRPIVSL
jgi:hypothetical protein